MSEERSLRVSKWRSEVRKIGNALLTVNNGSHKSGCDGNDIHFISMTDVRQFDWL